MKSYVDDVLFDAFEKGDESTFNSNINNAKDFYEIEKKVYPIMFILTEIYCRGPENKELKEIQLEILKNMLREKHYDGQYVYKVNDCVKTLSNIQLNDFKPIDIALLNGKAELAIEMLKREDICLKKPVTGIKGSSTFAIQEAFDLCEAAAVFMLEKGLVSLDDVAYVNEAKTVYVKDNLYKLAHFYDQYDFSEDRTQDLSDEIKRVK